MTYAEYLSLDYKDLVKASNKITGGSALALDLLHDSIMALSYKANLQDVIDSGACRFYLIKIMMVQWRSNTGPFYRNYVKQSLPIFEDFPDTEEDNEDEEIKVKKIKELVDQLPWYEKTLFNLFVEGDHNYSSMSKETLIPRTSISLTVRRVKDHVKTRLNEK